MPVKFTPVNLTSDEIIRYNQIAVTIHRELVSRAFTVDLEPRLPLMTKNRVKNAKCVVTGQKVQKGDDCLILLANVVGVSIHKKIAVFKNIEAFRELLAAGSFAGLRLAKKQVKADERAAIPFESRGKSVAHCIQCGNKMERPAGMSGRDFGRIRRCDSCKETGKLMPLNVQRFCRTCGEPFTPSSSKGSSSGGEANCPKHRYLVVPKQ